MPMSIEKKKNDSDAVPCACQRRRALEREVDADAVDADAEDLDRELRGDRRR